MNNKITIAVAGMMIKDDKVLLVRHTYGGAKDKLLIPGGHVEDGEMPESAVVREIEEETGIIAKVDKLMGMRFSVDNWYAVFTCDYIEGTPKSDGRENSEAVFMDIDKALERDDLTDTTRHLLYAYINGQFLKKSDYRPSRYAEDEYGLYI